MLRPTLIRNQVVEVRQPRQKRLLVTTRMMEPLHREQFPLDSVMSLVQQGAGHRHPGAFKDCIPARLLVLEPAPDALAVGYPSRKGDVIGKVAEPLPQRKYPQALALAHPVQDQTVNYGAEQQLQYLTKLRLLGSTKHNAKY